MHVKNKKISILSLGTDLTVWILEIRFFAAMMCLSSFIFVINKTTKNQ